MQDISVLKKEWRIWLIELIEWMWLDLVRSPPGIPVESHRTKSEKEDRVNGS